MVNKLETWKNKLTMKNTKNSKDKNNGTQKIYDLDMTMIP